MLKCVLVSPRKSTHSVYFSSVYFHSLHFRSVLFTSLQFSSFQFSSLKNSVLFISHQLNSFQFCTLHYTPVQFICNGQPEKKNVSASLISSHGTTVYIHSVFLVGKKYHNHSVCTHLLFLYHLCHCLYC